MSKFGDAFASARKAGKKTFTYNGKSYTTKTKEEAAAPIPKTRKSKTPITKGGRGSGSTTPYTKGGNSGNKTKSGLKNGGRPAGFSNTKYKGPFK